MSKLDEIKKRLKTNGTEEEQETGTEQSTGMSRLDKIKQQVNGNKTTSTTEESRLDKIKKQVNGNKTSFTSVPAELNDLINEYTTFMNDAKTSSEKLGYSTATANLAFGFDDRYRAISEKIKDAKTKYNLNRQSSELSDKEKELNNYLNQLNLSASQTTSVFWNAFDYYRQWETEEDYNKAVASAEEYERLKNLDIEATESAIKMLEAGGRSGEMLNKKKTDLASAKRIQEGIKLAGVADPNSEYYDPDFNKYSGYKSSYSGDTDDKFYKYFAVGYDDPTYEYINNAESGIKSSVYYNTAGSSDIKKWKIYDHMTEDEIAIYNYYYAKNGKEKASEYLESIRESLNARSAASTYDIIGGNGFLETVFGLYTGVENFATGIAGLFSDDDYFAPTSSQILGQLIAEGNEKEGDWWGQLAYDVAQSVGNMLPSVLVGTVTGGWGTAISMGASAAGNAKAQMINLGYDKTEANLYGLMVGASEALLEKFLGGITGVSDGGIFTKLGTKALGKVDNALARVAITIGGKMADEAFEEGLQTILEPWFESVVTGADFDAPDIDEVLYSGLLGALTAGVFDIGGTVVGQGAIAENNAIRKQGKELMAQGIDINKLAELGKDTSFVSADSVAYRLAGKVNENTGAYTIARMFSEMNAQLTAQNQADIMRSLERKGIAPKDAKTITTALANVVAGVEITKKQQKAIESNPVVAKTMQDVILNKNSTVRQRMTQFNESVFPKSTEATTETSQEATEQAQTVTPTENSTLIESAENKAENVSDDGKTKQISTGEEISIKRIASTKGGLSVELDNGSIIKASDISYSSDAEATMFDMLSRMETSPEVANEIFNSFKPTDMKQALNYFVNIPLAYNYGKIGYAKGLNKVRMSKEESYRAYNQGRKYAEAKAVADTKTPNKADTKTEAKTEKGGIIYENGFTYDESKANEMQKVSMAHIEVIKQMTNLEVHVFESVIKDGKRVAFIDGKWRTAPNGFFRNGNQIFIDINAGNKGEGAMLSTMGHEVAHYIRRWNAKGFKELADFLFKHYGHNGVSVDALIETQKDKIIKRYKFEGKALPSEAKLFDIAYEEVVADAMSDMLADPRAYEKLAQLKSQNRTLWQKIGEAIKSVLDKFKKALGIYKDAPVPWEAQHVRDFTPDVYNKLQDLYLKAFVEADANYEATIGSRNLEDFSEAVNENGETLFQYRAMEADEDTYKDMLRKWGKMTEVQIDNLFETIDNAMVLIKANLEALDYAWEADIDDRSFSPIKKNTDKLYKVSVDFSTLCRKRLLQQTIQGKLQEALDRSLTKEEGIAIRDALMAIQEEGRQIEIACALCYVESARMKSHNQIKKFLNNREDVLKNFFASKSGGDIKSRIKQAEAEARERLGVGNTPLTRLPANAAKEIRDAKKEAKASYVPSSKEAELIEIAKGMTVNDFATPAGLENLAKNYPELFDAYASFIVNATHAKGIENDTWWRAGDSYARNKSGDINISDTLIDNMNRENGLRSQSWSDFQVIHLLDYIAATIELSTRNSKEQIYTKVPDFVDLMGLTNAMLNMSLIPTREFNGSLEYDAVEGMPYDMAIKLREAYPNTAGTICIGIDNEQIRMLLADIIIDYVIPYHRSGMSAHTRKAMHLPTWSEYEDYQSEKNLSRADAEKQAKKYGVKLLNASDPNYQKGTSFSEWFDLREAQQITKMENAHPTDKAKQKKYGVMYGGYMAMQNAANNYLKLCAERGLAPKFSHENANFTTEENYWKLLIDRKMVNNATGEIIEQQSLKPIFSEEKILRILNDELERYPKVKADQEYAIRRVTEKMLSGEVKGGMSAKAIADVMKKPVDNVAKVNILASAEDTMFSERDSLGNELSEEQQEFFKDSRVRDVDGNLLVVYHGTNVKRKFYKFNTEYSPAWFTSSPGYANAFTRGDGKKMVHKVYLNITNPLYLGNIDGVANEENLKYLSALSKIDVSILKDILLEEKGEHIWKITNSSKFKSLAKKQGYDGFIAREGGVSSWATFDSEQVKSVDNIYPSTDPDIRYSDRDALPNFDDIDAWFETLSAEELKELMGETNIDTIESLPTKRERRDAYVNKLYEQGDLNKIVSRLVKANPKMAEYFANTKMNNKYNPLFPSKTDEYIVMFHGTPGDFNIFDTSRVGKHGTAMGSGVYFTSSLSYAESYKEDTGRVIATLLKIEKPLSRNKLTITKDQFKTFVKQVVDPTGDDFLSNYGDVNSIGYDRLLNKAANELFEHNSNDADLIEDVYVTSRMDFDEFHNGLTETLGYDGVIAWNKAEGTQAIVFKSNQAKEIFNFNPTSDPDIRYSERDSDRYSYEALISKPDMRVTTISNSVPSNRADIVVKAKQNAASVGKTNKDGSVSVYVEDVDADVVLSKKGLVHSLDRRFEEIAPVTVQAGEILRNSIKINELIPSKEEADSSYVLIGVAQNSNGELYVVRFVVNKFSNELDTMEVLYAINAKKSTAVPNAPLVSTPNYRTTISIAQLLEFVNNHFPDILPEQVLRHFGYDARPEGKVGESALYQDRDTELVSNRTLLANALESVAQNDIEKNKLKQYKSKIALIESEQAKLEKVKAEANELRFTKGRTQAETKRMRELDAEATMIANCISTYDRQLLNLESTTALKNVLEREKKLAYKKAEQRGKEALQRQRERAAQTVREVMTRNQESRKKAMEGRHKTEMRHKIKKVVSDLNKLLLHGTKERNIKPGLQQAVAMALEAINMDTVSANARIAKLKDELLKAKTPEKIAEVQHKIDHIQNMGDRMSDKLEALGRAYREIKNSTGNEYSSQFKEEATLIEGKIESVLGKVGNTPLRDMSLSQLEAVYDLYTMVLTTVRNANGVWRQGKLEDLQQNASAVMAEVDELPKIKSEGSKFRQIVRAFKWNNMTPYYAFDRIGSNTFMKFFKDFIEAQNTYARDIAEVKEFAHSAREKYNYNKWDLDKVYDFKLKDGRTFSTTLKHMLSIYAYSKREQALDHMSVGGFFHNDKATFRKKGGIIEMVRTDDVGYKVDFETLEEIKEALGKEKMLYVDEMQEYLTKMGEKGNEVTRVMWGIDIFKEKVYFPLKSKNDFIKSSTETAQAVSLKNDGMTKETVPGASNPIVLEAFDDVWARHTERMSQYHSFVIPIDNLNKIHQYGTWAGTDSMAVSTLLAGRFGNAVNEYISQFIKDMNGNVVSQGVTNPFMSFFSKFKKTAVGMSLSTVVQQPTAIVRAMSLVDGKYFVGKPNLTGLSKKWGELKTYAPIAIIKEIGGFDAGSGVQVTNWINSDAKTGIDKVMNVIDDVSTKGAELADMVGWTTIWEAVKRETKATTNLAVGSEAFLKKAGERFTEVIVQTQVYDSTLSRSGFMRSKGDIMKMLTAFMGEPTLSVNMLYNSVVNAMRGGSKLKAAKTIGCVYVSSILASAFASAIYALNDDDEDESYLEKYMQAFGGEFISDIVLMPVTSLPAVKDFVSIFQGWDVERTDVAIFKDIKDAFDGLFSENKSGYKKIEDFAGAIGSMFGLPVKNLLKTGRQIYNSVNDIFVDKITGGNLGDAFLEGITNEKKSKTKKLYDAIVSGDTARLEVLREDYEDEDAYTSAIRKALRENDPRIQEAAQALSEGDVAEYGRIIDEIADEGNFEALDIKSAIESELNRIEKENSTEEDTPTEDKAESIYEAEHYYMALIKGDTYTANKVKEDIINTEVANGKSREEAEKNFYSSFNAKVRDGYADGTINRTKAMEMLISHGGMESNDAYWTMDKYDYYKQNGSYDGYSKYGDFHNAVRTGVNLKSVIQEYTSHGVEKQTLASQITSYFKPLYINMTNSERAGIKGYLLNAYAQLGYNRYEKSRDIDRWLQ